MDEYKVALYQILKAEKSLHEFVKQAWHVIEGPNKPFVDGWHLRALCEHLEAVTNGDIRRLVINVPPRTSKSSIVSVMWPAWWWLRDPSIQFLCASHSSTITERDSGKCRNLIRSEWYQDRWHDLYQILKAQDTIAKFSNTVNGYRGCTSVGSKVIGLGGDVQIIDDPNDANEAESDVIRNKTNEWFANFSTRVNNFKTSVRVLIQQRTSAEDVTGYIKQGKNAHLWTHLVLPMEYVGKRQCKTIALPSTNGKVWEDPRVNDGDLLWPQGIGVKELQELKDDLRSEYRISGQLQQSPSPAEGGIIKKSWFSWWKESAPPKLLQVIQSWDTAIEAKDLDCYSACTTWGLFNDDKGVPNVILLGLWRGRVEYPELRTMAQRLFKDYRDDGSILIKPDGKHVPHMVLVEAKANGSSLVQDLTRAGILAVRFDPGKYGDKIQRVKLSTPIIQAGRVWVPARPPAYTTLRSFGETLVELCGIFPNSDARDVVDSMSQVLLRLIYSRFLTHPEDEQDNGHQGGPKHGFYGYEGD